MVEQENLVDPAKSVYLLTAEQPLRDSIATELNGSYAVSSFSDPDQLLSSLKNSQPDFIICHQDSLDAQFTLLEIQALAPESRQLVVGTGISVSRQMEAIKQGARGYFALSLPLSKLSNALECILLGEVWVDRHTVSALIDELTQDINISPEQQQAINSLSPKELEVAKRVSHGSTNKMIANKMQITERTVKAHLTTIFQKLQLTDRLSVAILFRDLR